MIAPELEDPRPPAGAGFSDAVTCAFGDPAREIFGLVRVGLAPGAEPDGPATASLLALLFEARRLVAVVTEGGVAVPDPQWRELAVGPVALATDEPLAAWRARLRAEGAGFDLRFAALHPPAAFDAQSPVARAGGGEGYDQLCHVTGEATIDGAAVAIDCLGQRSHSWGAPDWEGVQSARLVAAWVGPDHALTVRSLRPADAAGHEDDALTAVLVDGAGPGAVISEAARARLSTTYDDDGRQRRAGLELWVGEEDEYPLRITGEALCGTSLELGRLHLDMAFFRWRQGGREGVGRYELVRRA